MNSSLIHGKYVIARIDGVDSATVIQDGAVHQQDGEIIEVGNFQDLKGKYPAAKLIGSQDHIVMPGLINDHDHIGLARFQLGVPLRPLEISSGLGLIAKNLDPYLDHLWGAVQMIESGTTTVQNMYTPGRGKGPIDPESTDKVVRAYRDAGLRLSFAPILVDQNSMVAGPSGRNEAAFTSLLPPNLSERFTEFIAQGYAPADEIIASAEDIFTKYDRSDNGLIRVTAAPTGEQRCSEKLLMGLRELSRKYQTTTHIHILQTIYQKVAGRNTFGMSDVQHLDELGFLGPDVVCGHSVWVTDEDIETLRRTGTYVCHNASSNLRLQSGIAPVGRFLEEDIPVAIGTDDGTINGDKDMFQEMRLVKYLHRVPGMENIPPTSHQVLQMATVNGARASGFGDTIGTLEPGKRADVILINLQHLQEPYLDPEVSIVDAVVHLARGVDVDTVIVDGEEVMKDRRLTRIDKNDIIKEIQKALDRPLKPEEKSRRKLGLDLEPHLRRFFKDSQGEMPPPHSYYNGRY